MYISHYSQQDFSLSRSIFDTYAKGQEMKITDLASGTLLNLPEVTSAKVLKTKLLVIICICFCTNANKLLHYILRDTISTNSSRRLCCRIFFLNGSVITCKKWISQLIIKTVSSFYAGREELSKTCTRRFKMTLNHCSCTGGALFLLLYSSLSLTSEEYFLECEEL